MRNKRQLSPALTMQSRDIHKNDSVASTYLKPIDAQPLPVCQGQFALRLLVHRADAFFAAIRCLICPQPRLFHKGRSELNGIGSSFLCNQREKAIIDVIAPRGGFTLRPSQGLRCRR
jgi:hypothetical protein